MGTRSVTIVKEKNSKPLIAMYRQYDGYPSGHGLELAEFLKNFKITNGLSIGENKNTANGAGCLAAQIVANFKTEPGGIYLTDPQTTPGNNNDEYFYTVTAQQDKPVHIEILDVYENKVLFTGSAQELTEGIEEFK